MMRNCKNCNLQINNWQNIRVPNCDKIMEKHWNLSHFWKKKETPATSFPLNSRICSENFASRSQWITTSASIKEWNSSSAVDWKSMNKNPKEKGDPFGGGRDSCQESAESRNENNRSSRSTGGSRSRVSRNLQSAGNTGRIEAAAERFPLLPRRFGFLEISGTDSRHYREIQFLWKQFPPRLPASRNSSWPRTVERRKIREQGDPVVVVSSCRRRRAGVPYTPVTSPRSRLVLSLFLLFFSTLHGSPLLLVCSLFFFALFSVSLSLSLSLSHALSLSLSVWCFRASSTFIGVWKAPVGRQTYDMLLLECGRSRALARSPRERTENADRVGEG